MAVVIRLSRTGKSHSVSYRIVATDKQNPRDGRFAEILGFYNPNKSGDEKYKLNEEKYQDWLKKGAVPSPAVSEIVATYGNPAPKVRKKKKAKEEAPAAESPNTPAAAPAKELAKTEEVQSTTKPEAEEKPAETKVEPAPEPVKEEEAK